MRSPFFSPLLLPLLTTCGLVLAAQPVQSQPLAPAEVQDAGLDANPEQGSSPDPTDASETGPEQDPGLPPLDQTQDGMGLENPEPENTEPENTEPENTEHNSTQPAKSETESENGLTEDNDRAEAAQMLLRQGSIDLGQGNVEGAIAAWQQAFDLYQQLGDSLGEAKTLGNLGYVANLIGSYDQAIALYQTALTIAREIENPDLQVNFLGSLGLVYATLGQTNQAIASYEMALPLARSLGNRTGEGAIAGGLAFAYEEVGRYEDATEFYQLMLEVATEQGDNETATVAASSIQRVERAIAMGDESSSPSSDPSPLSTPTDSADSAQPSPSASVNLDLSGTATDPLTQLQQQLQQVREADDVVAEAITLLQLGRLYRDRNQFTLAIAAFEQSLDLATNLDIPALTERSLLNLASLYQGVGQEARSQQAAHSLLTMAEQLGDPISEITALQNLAGVSVATGNLLDAIAAYEQALALIKTVDDPFNEAIALTLLAEAHLGAQAPDKAVELLTEAMAIAQMLDDADLVGVIWGSMGKAHGIAGDYPAAIEALQQNLAQAQAGGNALGQALAHSELGTVYFLADELDQATTHFQDAIALWEEQQATGEIVDPLQVSGLAPQQQAYQTLQQVLVAQGKTQEALAIAEQERAQAFTTLRSHYNEGTGVEATEEPAIKRLGPETTPPSLESPSSSLTIEQIQQIAREQNATLVVYSITNQPTALLISGTVAPMPTADLLIWVVNTTGDIAFRQMPIPRPLAAMVADFRQALGIFPGHSPQPNRNSTTVAPATAELYSLLIEPIQDLLPPGKGDRVILFPQEDLFLVPFAALQAPEGTYLIEDYTLGMAPSIRVLAQVQAIADAMPTPHPPTDEVLIVGNPEPMPLLMRPSDDGPAALHPLPGSQREAEAIATTIFQTEALVGAAATEANVRERLPTAHLIHLATHGLLDYGDPRTSGVRDIPGAIALAPSAGQPLLAPSSADLGTEATAQNGWLTAAELQTMNLTATLVALSACDPGKGDIHEDGVLGLTRSLFVAGVPSIVMSLWVGDNNATTELMTEFYRLWLLHRQILDNQVSDQASNQNTVDFLDKAAALRQAMLNTMAHYPEPRLWAAFTLIGAN